MEPLSAFWWNARPNFGDGLTKLLLETFTGREVHHAVPEAAQVVVVGSVLEALPPGWGGVVAGAGKLRELTEPNLASATVLALRGALSARGVPGDYILGDPGLLVDELVSIPGKFYDLGVVPHWSDTDLAGRFARYHPKVISTTQDPLDAIRDIGSCKKIVASSLHGIIVADAFGIPRRAELFSQAQREGGDFKFRDYASAICQPIEFGKLQTPYRWKIEQIQRDLFEVFQRLGSYL